MEVSVDVAGGENHDVAVDGTYADLCHAVGYSPHEVAVLVDGRPVPVDGAIETDSVRLIRLVRGG